MIFFFCLSEYGISEGNSFFFNKREYNYTVLSGYHMIQYEKECMYDDGYKYVIVAIYYPSFSCLR